MATTSNVKTVYIIVYVAVYCPSLTHKTHKSSQTHVYYCFLRTVITLLSFLLPSPPPPQPFYDPFSGTTRVSRAKRELLDFMMQGKINRGRYTGHPAGRHSIRTNQCLPPPSRHIFTGRMPFLPPNQEHQSTEGILINKWQTIIIRPIKNYTALGTAHPTPRHIAAIEVGTVSLPASSRFVGLSFPHCAVTGFHKFSFTFYTPPLLGYLHRGP